MKRLFISKVVMEHYDCSEKFECLSTYNGCLYDKAERYLLHRAIGNMGDFLCKEYFDLGMKEIQRHISQQEVMPLLEIGVLELMDAKQFENIFNELYSFNKKEQEWIIKAKNSITNLFDRVHIAHSSTEKFIDEICKKLVRIK